MLAILPIDAGRYGTKEMLHIFGEQKKIDYQVQIEGAAAISQAESGLIPKTAGRDILKTANTAHITAKKIKALEAKKFEPWVQEDWVKGTGVYWDESDQCQVEPMPRLPIGRDYRLSVRESKIKVKRNYTRDRAASRRAFNRTPDKRLWNVRDYLMRSIALAPSPSP